MAASSPRSPDWARALAILLALLLAPWTAAAQTVEPSGEETEIAGRARLRIGFELKGHWRDSDLVRFPIRTPFPPEALPVGQSQAFQETVDAGSHAELSMLTLWLAAEWRERWAAKLKLDLVDRYDRNPTSEDRKYDVDEAWIRWGREAEPAVPPPGRGLYVKLGKIPKFERQDDRHLESYGLISTAFNRFEDVGLELGFDLAPQLYLKASFTQGNPVFFRDPNALAGDNGISIFDGSVLNPDPELKSGFPILYDADTEELDFANPELGLGLGVRFAGAAGFYGVDVLAWHYQRDLADEVDMGGTFYGGDLDLLLGPGNAISLPVTGREKQETGANVWLYAGGFSFFAQYVDQDLAGLPLTGFEAEAAWAFDLPLFATFAGRQVLPYVQPAIRFSKLDPDFVGDRRYPAPSVWWYWEKFDLGLRLGLLEGLDLTVEWILGEFVRAGREESDDEFLATVRWELGREVLRR